MTDQQEIYQAKEQIRQAHSCVKRDDFAATETLYKEALETQQKALGSKHVDVAQTLLCISLMFRKQKRHSEAREYCRQCLLLREELLGPEHVDTIAGMRLLASLHGDENQYAESEQIYHEALRRNKNKEFAELIINDMAHLYLECKRYSDAEELLKSILSNRRSNPRTVYVHTLKTLRSLALVCFMQQKYSEAEALLREVLEHERKEPAPKIYIPINDTPISPELEAAFAELNTALSSEESVSWFAARDAEQQQKRQKDGKLVVAGTLYDLACVCECMQQYEEAETLLREALTLLRDVLGVEHTRTQRITETLQRVLQGRLVAVAEQGDADTFISLFHGEAKPKDKPHTKTALIWGAKHGYAKLVSALLRHGESIEAKDWKGRTALIWAAHEGHNQIVNELLDNGANVEVKDYWGRTAFLTIIN